MDTTLAAVDKVAQGRKISCIHIYKIKIVYLVYIVQYIVHNAL